jgi:hypothetical protein
VKLNDRLNTFILIGQAPIIAGLICLIFNDITPAVPFLLAVSAVWFGTNNAAREIVGEAAIYKRERMFNQGILSYILSKITVLGTFAAIQSLLFTAIIAARYKDTDPQWADFSSAFLWMLSVSVAASLMGLLLSSIVSTTEKVMTLVPIALIPQIMLAGAIAPITSKAVEILSYFTLARWGNEGFCHVQEKVLVTMPKPVNLEVADPNTIGVESQANQNDQASDKMHDVIVNSLDQLKDNFHKSYEDNFQMAYQFELDWMAIGILSLLFFVGIYIALKRKDSMKIR